MSNAKQKIETVKDLMDLLSAFSPELKLAVKQPRRWVKKQPDETVTFVTGIEMNGYWLRLTTNTERMEALLKRNVQLDMPLAA